MLPAGFISPVLQPLRATVAQPCPPNDRPEAPREKTRPTLFGGVAIGEGRRVPWGRVPDRHHLAEKDAGFPGGTYRAMSWDDGDSPDQWMRGRTADQVEEMLIEQALRFARPGRVLEIGAGTGRLLPVLSGRATQLYAVDMNRRFLLGARRRGLSPFKLSLICAAAARLPFPDQSISTIVLVRVFHRLTNPVGTVRELTRVISPGGVVVLSHVPDPSLKTWYYRLWKHLQGSPDPRPGALTRREFQTVIESAGLEIVGEFGCGFEELPILEHVPVRWMVRIGDRLGRAPLFPTRILVLRAGAKGAQAP